MPESLLAAAAAAKPFEPGPPLGLTSCLIRLSEPSDKLSSPPLSKRQGSQISVSLSPLPTPPHPSFFPLPLYSQQPLNPPPQHSLILTLFQPVEPLPNQSTHLLDPPTPHSFPTRDTLCLTIGEVEGKGEGEG